MQLAQTPNAPCGVRRRSSNTGCRPAAAPAARAPTAAGRVHSKHGAKHVLRSSVCRASDSEDSGSPQQATKQQQQQQQQQEGLLQAALFRSPPNWAAFLGTLFQQGALLGTLLDGIHSRVGLQVYQLAPVTLGPLHTSLLVPPLLGVLYVVLGLLAAAADNLSPGAAATQAAQARAGGETGVAFLALNFGALAASLALSAALYEAQVPPGTIFGVLAAVTAANWALFDRTPQGLALAALCGLGAPAAEVVLMAASHCWSYPRADLGPLVSWVPWCYAFYTCAVQNLARYLWATCRFPEQ